VLDEAVGQGGLAVVDVGDDAEVSDVFHNFIGSMEQNSSANRPSSTALAFLRLFKKGQMQGARRPEERGVLIVR
jgi:hypothetical protein